MNKENVEIKDTNKKGKVWCLGDAHGGNKALLQCLERSNFNRETDTLIQLGDVVDGWNEVYECVETLLSIPNLISIKGNHDDWFYQFLSTSQHPVSWAQGGGGTLASYCKHLDKNYLQRYGSEGYSTDLLDSDVPRTHYEFFRKQLRYYKDEQNNIFVHGGFNRHELLSEQSHDDVFWWDRDLWMQALSVKQMKDGFENLLEINKFVPQLKIKEPHKEIFIGHTTTQSWKQTTPMNACNIWNLDTGAGWGKGKLTIMDIETKEYFQSDPLSDLYPGERGRG